LEIRFFAASITDEVTEEEAEVELSSDSVARICWKQHTTLYPYTISTDLIILAGSKASTVGVEPLFTTVA